MARSGRRTSGDARAAILEAAGDLFLLEGYDGTTMRAIAGQAGCDPALISHYFGSKDGLFAEVMQLPARPAQVLAGVVAGPRREMGARLVRAVLEVWDRDGGVAIAGLIRLGLETPAAGALLREMLAREILAPLGGWIRAGEVEVEERVALVASQMIGLAVARYVLVLEPLASLDSDAVVARVGPTVQRYLTGR